jgi:DNA processing protein
LLSEFLPETAALAHRFPRRNRIIAGLSLGTLVVEAAQRSGSLITAMAALEQGREVMAVPQPVSHAGGAGCNALLRAGAVLVTDPADVATALADAWPAGMPAPAVVESAPAERVPALLGHLSFEAQSLDAIAASAGHSSAALLAALTDLELEGWVARCPGGYIRCR